MTQKKKPRTKRNASNADTESHGERRQMIAEAAYYKAERRGFVPGNDQEDWYEAEREIDSED